MSRWHRLLIGLAILLVILAVPLLMTQTPSMFARGPFYGPVTPRPPQVARSALSGLNRSPVRPNKIPKTADASRTASTGGAFLAWEPVVGIIPLDDGNTIAFTTQADDQGRVFTQDFEYLVGQQGITQQNFENMVLIGQDTGPNYPAETNIIDNTQELFWSNYTPPETGYQPSGYFPPNTFFVDDFSNGTENWLLNTWQEGPGSWWNGEFGGVWVLAGEGHQFVRLSFGEDWTDYKVSFLVRFEPQSFMHLNLRQVDGNRYYVGLGSSHSDVYLNKHLADGNQFIDLANTPLRNTPFWNPLSADQWHWVEVSVRGEDIQVWIDEIEVIHYIDEDTPILEGTFGFEVLEGTVRIDDVAVTPP